MELTVAGGYFQPGKTPQVINKVNELIVLGYVPYGTPTYNEASGWISQLMVLGYGGSASDYTLTTGYLDKTPYFPKKPPVNGNWVLLGSLLARSNNFYVHAWLDGVAAGPAIDLANTVGTLPLDRTTGTLPVSRGGTGATTELGARTNLALGTTSNVTFNSVTTTKRAAGQSAFVAQGLNYTGGTTYQSSMYDATGATLLGQLEMRANNDGSAQLINRDPTGGSATRFWTLQRNGILGCPGGVTASTGDIIAQTGKVEGNLIKSSASTAANLMAVSAAGITAAAKGAVVWLEGRPTGYAYFVQRDAEVSWTSTIISTLPATSGTLANATPSDSRFKSDITDLDANVSIDNIARMRPVSFRFTDDKRRLTRRGLIAQELQLIDDQYVKVGQHAFTNDAGEIEVTERLLLDDSALLMEALVAINGLTARIRALEEKLK